MFADYSVQSPRATDLVSGKIEKVLRLKIEKHKDAELKAAYN